MYFSGSKLCAACTYVRTKNPAADTGVSKIARKYHRRRIRSRWTCLVFVSRTFPKRKSWTSRFVWLLSFNEIEQSFVFFQKKIYYPILLLYVYYHCRVAARVRAFNTAENRVTSVEKFPGSILPSHSPLLHVERLLRRLQISGRRIPLGGEGVPKKNFSIVGGFSFHFTPIFRKRHSLRKNGKHRRYRFRTRHVRLRAFVAKTGYIGHGVPGRRQPRPVSRSAITSPCRRVNRRQTHKHGKWYPVVVTAGSIEITASAPQSRFVWRLSWRRVTVPHTVCGAVTAGRRVLLPGAREVHGRRLWIFITSWSRL